MYYVGALKFDIVDGKILDSEGEELPLEDCQPIAKDLLDSWWTRRTIEVNGATFNVCQPENERVINQSLVLDEDAYLLDKDDNTVIIPLGQVRSFASAIRNERIRTMQFWDNAIALLETDRPALIRLIESLLSGSPMEIV